MLLPPAELVDPKLVGVAMKESLGIPSDSNVHVEEFHCRIKVAIEDNHTTTRGIFELDGAAIKLLDEAQRTCRADAS